VCVQHGGLWLTLVYPALFVAGMTRSMQFTTVSTLAFADISAEQRSGASALSAMTQQVAATLGVAFGAMALALFQNVRDEPALSLGDFQNALLTGAALMAVAAVWSLRLPKGAGAEVSGRA